MNKLKTYEVELRRISFVVVTVEAESVDEAEYKAMDEVQRNQGAYANWEVESVEEQ